MESVNAMAQTGPGRTAGPGTGTEQAGQPEVRIEQLTRRYGRTVALDQVDLELSAGITGLLGPNGAGKTTLLSILATVASPDAGRLTVLGCDPAEAAERVQIRRCLGYLPQELGYHRHFRVAAFLDYVAILKEITSARQRHAEVARVLAETGLESLTGRRILRALPHVKGYTFLASLHGVDYYPDEPRLGVLYELMDMKAVDRITVKARVSTEDPRIPTVTELHPGAEFPEREVYDMFGVVFEGHPDLRRILMPEDFEGFPQRRDYPIGGEPVLFTFNEQKSYGKWQ